jgi:acyl-CoA thioester hydrolase
MGVVYHSNYLVWLEVARTDLIRDYGITYAELERDGYGLAVAELGIRYRAAAHYDDDIVVTAVLSDVRSRSLRFEYEVTRASDSVRLATAFTALVSVDPASGRPVALPPAIKQLFAREQTT